MVYHDEQNKKKLVSKSRENEFGDEKIIWRQSLIGYKSLKYFWDCERLATPHHIFFKKSGFVTFLCLSKSDFMQKSEKSDGGKYENFCD